MERRWGLVVACLAWLTALVFTACHSTAAPFRTMIPAATVRAVTTFRKQA
jgi:hypothetical protein